MIIHGIINGNYSGRHRGHRVPKAQSRKKLLKRFCFALRLSSYSYITQGRKIMDILQGLNPQQRDAVTHINGPILVLAGAGSGKTRVIIYRIAHLLSQGISPKHILAVTFTNKAAAEMKKRIEQFNETMDINGLWINTFHSASLRILRAHYPKKNFTIYDESDKSTVVKAVLKETNYDVKPNSVGSFISQCKNKMQTPSNHKPINFWEERMLNCYKLYQEQLEKHNGLDFDDIIMKTIHLFQESPQVLSHYQTRFNYLMVDEYQDTNYSQYLLIRMLAEKHHNICVVGDDDQSIYGFRGADISNILNFEKDYPSIKTVRLEQNYRSTKPILDTANRVIEFNRNRKGKQLWTEKTVGAKVEFRLLRNEHDEANFVVRTISEAMSRENRKLIDFVVLYRVNAQSRVLEDAFRMANIPYTIVGGMSFYSRKEIKDILSYLKIIVNPLDAVALKRIVNVPSRKIGASLVEKLEKYATINNLHLFEAMEKAELIDTLSDTQVKAVERFIKLIKKFMAIKDTMSISKLLNMLLLDSGYLESLKQEKTEEDKDRIENIKELVNVAVEFESKEQGIGLEDFLGSISLVANIDLWDDSSCVTLMTLHNVKGLEFPYVFLTGMEEGLFPHINSLNSDNIEEERRLCYVGMTRAKEKLLMTAASSRKLYGYGTGMPSCFILEAGIR
ncbi:ATP-dependent DNA helicase PcrA [Candidatus Desantisbacteria bacterium CG_4_9_14_3_um_filter_40_11]|uniref:DNA 3'-5' helicase n=1 Tax=Candidatus Desantisbacteria bacterium CG_4_9_14_3_um_filter_40_11 TaxID=1974546 RepID=A0A2M8AR46_9BACT|nr:MAG: ATP-dependent DNA helicase PcrA [Candidatus Desantisbacteria bacterium CG_4_9_14_3_um_filter_40_11]